MNKTKIEWTDYTWNPVTGCDKVSAGCRSCYAETMATRFWGDRKFTDVQMHPERLNEPYELGRKLDGKKVFVCDVSDLFHDKVTFEFIASVYAIMASMPLTTFQVLTKRPERALEFYMWAQNNVKNIENKVPFLNIQFPPINVWIGTSVEDQKQYDLRVPYLLQIPAAVRFLSCEPLLEDIDLCLFTGANKDFFNSRLFNWVICGGESGHMARPMHPGWVRSLRLQCASAGVPFFFKQWGKYAPHDGHHLNRPGKGYWVRYEDGKIYPQDKQGMVVGPEGSYHLMYKSGKSANGNMLDGVQYLEFPKHQSHE